MLTPAATTETLAALLDYLDETPDELVPCRGPDRRVWLAPHDYERYTREKARAACYDCPALPLCREYADSTTQRGVVLAGRLYTDVRQQPRESALQRV